MKKYISIILAINIFLLFLSYAFGKNLSKTDFPKIFDKECILDKYKTYTKLKKKWQNESSLLIVRQLNIKEVVELYRDDQLVRIEKNLLAVRILINSNPESIDTKKNINMWLSLTNKVELVLAERNARYKKLLKIVKDSRARVSHPDGDKLRKNIRSKIMKLPEFELLLKRFYAEIKKINQLRCNTI